MAKTMTVREVIRRIEAQGGYRVRTRGSHAIYEVGSEARPGGLVRARAVVPIHLGDVPPGTLRSIQRQLAPALGERWLIP